MRRLLLLAAFLAPCVAESQTVTRVDVRTFQFAPDTLRLTVGSTVVWTNRDDIAHTVSAGTPAEPAPAFATALEAQGATARHTFDRSGTFSYFCERHQFMRGTIIVTR